MRQRQWQFVLILFQWLCIWTRQVETLAASGASCSSNNVCVASYTCSGNSGGTCVDCPPGYYCNEETYGFSSPQICPVGTFCLVRSFLPTNCTYGTYQDVEGQSTCKSVPTSQPTDQPSISPTNQPSVQPSSQPSSTPSMPPTNQPSMQVRKLINKLRKAFYSIPPSVLFVWPLEKLVRGSREAGAAC